MITAFKQSDNIADCYSLYVDGIKTNMYFFTRPMTGMDIEEEKAQAYLVKKLIEEGKLQPFRGTWDGFDICDACYFTLSAIQVLDPSFRPPFSNQLLNVHTSYKIELEQHPAIIKELTGKRECTQYCKRLVNAEISHTVGIRFAAYGYALYFI